MIGLRLRTRRRHGFQMEPPLGTPHGTSPGHRGKREGRTSRPPRPAGPARLPRARDRLSAAQRPGETSGPRAGDRRRRRTRGDRARTQSVEPEDRKETLRAPCAAAARPGRHRRIGPPSRSRRATWRSRRRRAPPPPPELPPPARAPRPAASPVDLASGRAVRGRRLFVRLIGRIDFEMPGQLRRPVGLLQRSPASRRRFLPPRAPTPPHGSH